MTVNEGIQSGDMFIFDKNLNAFHGKIAIAGIDGEIGTSCLIL